MPRDGTEHRILNIEMRNKFRRAKDAGLNKKSAGIERAIQVRYVCIKLLKQGQKSFSLIVGITFKE